MSQPWHSRAVGFIKRKGSKYCVHNEATGKVIRVKGKARCYADPERAELVLAALDCHYTGRRCKTVAKLLHGGASLGSCRPRSRRRRSQRS